MTVQELIDELMKIENKQEVVKLQGPYYGRGYYIEEISIDTAEIFIDEKQE